MVCANAGGKIRLLTIRRRLRRPIDARGGASDVAAPKSVWGIAATSRNYEKRSAENQKFYLVKFIFPRGDAASLLFGFDAEGKITGIGVESMAGE